jgi:eukaryotic-like serine/threonine-protein kinase
MTGIAAGPPVDGNLGPHEQLLGMALSNGWRVTERVTRMAGASGGCFSCGYFAEHESGQRAYLKALDFYSSLRESSDPARDLQPLIEAFNFERDLLRDCKDLSRVVTALADGAVQVQSSRGPEVVQYIIFELAESDVRSQMADADELDLAWKLRSLHHIAVGLDQLHGKGVVHQDVKPSNVLLFENKTSSKLGDLGRAAARGKLPPHYDATPPGDVGYAPPELLYEARAEGSEGRRQACDVYHLGSMIASLFTGTAMTPLVLMRLEPDFDWRAWNGSYSEVLPYIRAAFAEVTGYVADEIPMACRDRLTQALRELCDPDPALRGHPKDRTGVGSRYSVRRYVAAFDLLAQRAEVHLTRQRT